MGAHSNLLAGYFQRAFFFFFLPCRETESGKGEVVCPTAKIFTPGALGEIILLLGSAPAASFLETCLSRSQGQGVAVWCFTWCHNLLKKCWNQRGERPPSSSTTFTPVSGPHGLPPLAAASGLLGSFLRPPSPLGSHSPLQSGAPFSPSPPQRKLCSPLNGFT